MVNGSLLMAHGSWLMPQGSWLNAHGSWPRKIGAGSPRHRTLALIVSWPWALSDEPGGMSHEPWALSHEPLTVENRVINNLFNWKLHTFKIFKVSKFRSLKVSKLQSLTFSNYQSFRFSNIWNFKCWFVVETVFSRFRDAEISKHIILKKDLEFVLGLCWVILYFQSQ